MVASYFTHWCKMHVFNDAQLPDVPPDSFPTPYQLNIVPKEPHLSTLKYWSNQ